MISPAIRFSWILLLTATVLAPAKVEEWSDTQGNPFKGEPAEVMGPVALFRTSSGGGRRILWRLLSPADCVRFQEHVAREPARAADWSNSKSTLAYDLITRCKTRKGDAFVKADLTGRPEPLLIIAFFVDNSEGKSWDMLGQSLAPFQEVVRKFPGQIEGIQYGITHDKEAHTNMAMQMNVPWLLVDYSEQFRIQLLKDFAPRAGEFSLVVFNRNGVPLFSADNPGPDDLKRVFAETTTFLDLQRPENPRTWADRAHYLATIQPLLHRNDAVGPVLVGDPLVPQGLRERKIQLVAATISVGADGKATDVKLQEDPSIPAAIAPALSGALKTNTIFVPAVDHGKPVAGTYDYRLEIKP